ncbi:MAG: hypothetical protein IOC82_12445 [Aestuariivirga sp.]|nr:hypothetical protein [Aestuariivirga sp.]MCA3561827.1 hypothetical protein [Aestuariivirga sp.]
MPKKGTSGSWTSIDIEGRACAPENQVWLLAPPDSVAPDRLARVGAFVASVRALPPGPSALAVRLTTAPTAAAATFALGLMIAESAVAVSAAVPPRLNC